MMNKSVVCLSVLIFLFCGNFSAFSAGEEEYEFICKWGTFGTGASQFDGPSGIAVDSAGNFVYIADRFNNRIQKFTVNGAAFSRWGELGDGNREFNEPVSVAVDKNDRVFVVDRSNHRVIRFSSNGVFQTKWGSPVSGDRQFTGPEAIAVDAQGSVYVADTLNHRIQKFNSNGGFITKWGAQGTGELEFDEPRGVAVDSSGFVYVSDTNNARIQKFLVTTVTPTFVLGWGAAGTGNGQFNEPRGVATDKSDNVYVADWGNDRIQKFTSRGEFITKWGSRGRGDGQFRNPSDVAVDTAGNVYVTDFMNERIQKFRIAAPVKDPECLKVEPEKIRFNPNAANIEEIKITGKDVHFRGSEISFACSDVAVGQPKISSNGLIMTADLIILEGARNCSENLKVTLPDGKVLDCGRIELVRIPGCIRLDPSFVEADRQKTHRVDVDIKTEGADVTTAIISFDCEGVVTSKKSVSQDRTSMVVEFVILPEADSCIGNVELVIQENNTVLDCGVFEVKRTARCAGVSPDGVEVRGREPHIEEVTLSFEGADLKNAVVSFDCPDVMVTNKEILEDDLILDFIIWPEADNCTQPVLVSLPGGIELDCGSFFILKTDEPIPCLASYLLAEDEYDLGVLARFRDETLAASKPGRALIGYYYRFGDDVIEVMEKNAVLRQSTRFLLKPVIHVLDHLYQ